MKKIFITLFVLFINNFVLANENIHNAVYNDTQVFYSSEKETWSFIKSDENDLVFKKTLIEGDGAYSIYNKEDSSIAFVLTTDFELINNGKLIAVDNNLLKYYKLIYKEGFIETIELTEEEIKNLFPNAEIYKISNIDSDNKMWIHKPIFKKKTFILVNDTDRFFHRITCKSKNTQDPEIKGLFTISRYGIIRFTHFGERDGKLTFYIR